MAPEGGYPRGMRAVVQRVTEARVEVEGEVVGAIRRGLVAFIGAAEGDGEADERYIADKVAGLRVFEDEAGKMNRSVQDVGGSVLAVSQFTLLGDARKGRRPSFSHAMDPEAAREAFERVVAGIQAHGVDVAVGRFRAHMRVLADGDGPVTILLDSRRTF